MDEACTIYRTAGLVGKRWTLLILLELYKGAKWKRYSQLKLKLLRITPKILSLRLRELESEGLLDKKVDSSSVPIKCEYSLTKQGLELVDVVSAMKKWSIKWRKRNPRCNVKDCKDCVM